MRFGIFAPALIFSLMAIPEPGFAHGSAARPSLKFSRELLKSFPLPQVRIEAACDPSFLRKLEASLRGTWEQCRSLGASEPSECQRDLFGLCLQDAAEIINRARAVCARMANASGQNLALGSQGQAAGLASAASTNKTGAHATKLVIDELAKSEEALLDRRKAQETAGTAYLCINSSSTAKYRAELGESLQAIDSSRAVFRQAARARKEFLDEFMKNEAESDARGGKLGAPRAKNRQAPLPEPAGRGKMISFPSVALRPIDLYGIKVIPHGPLRLENERAARHEGSDRHFPWNHEPRRTGQKFGPGGRPEPLGETRMPRAPSGSTPTSALDGVVPGSALLQALAIKVDPAFTDKERATITFSVERIPVCHRSKLANLIVRRRSLGGSRTTCTQGLYFESGGKVYVDLDPAPKGCDPGINMETTVHEFYHVVGGFNDDELEKRYDREIFRAFPRCPVTWYGTIYYEDFAEGGTILSEAPGIKPNPQPCVKQKLQKLRALLLCGPSR